MPVYVYKCNQCGEVAELDRRLTDETRHMVESEICGTMIRDWKSVNINTVNLRSARG